MPWHQDGQYWPIEPLRAVAHTRSRTLTLPLSPTRTRNLTLTRTLTLSPTKTRTLTRTLTLARSRTLALTLEQVTAWIALDRSDEGCGALRLVPGSHAAEPVLI